MFYHLKEAVIFTWSSVTTFFRFFWLGMLALAEWLKEFPLIDKWYYSFLLPKAIIILVGYLVTSIPLWLLVLISFLPIGTIAPLFFVAFILALAHF